ncbi:MAG: flagellar FliJ family protein [Rhodospirillaceae bacterium]
MKDLNTLIRLHKFRVDEKRREVGGMIAVVTDLERQARALEAEIRKEQEIASNSPVEAGAIYGSYANLAIKRREQFAAAIAEVEERLVEAQEQMREEFLELKGYEIIQDYRDAEVALEAARAEQFVLDEIGLNAYRRRKAEEV